MKKLILICIIIVAYTFAACNRNAADDDKEFIYEIVESGSRIVTEAEKSQAAEKRLIEVMQSAIEAFANVNEVVISIDSPNETEKTVNVLVITKPDTQLTDEGKADIVRFIKNSVSNTGAVNLIEEQRAS